MKMNEIMEAIKDLAKCQGFYGRLLENLLELKEDEPELYEEVSAEWEAQNFRDSVDLVLYLEC